MDANITLNTIAFNKTFDEKDYSERKSVTRGINTPDIWTIKRQEAVSSKTKQKMVRTTPRIDRVCVDSTTGATYQTSIYAVVEVNELSQTADVANVLATFRALVASTTPDYLNAMIAGEV